MMEYNISTDQPSFGIATLYYCTLTYIVWAGQQAEGTRQAIKGFNGQFSVVVDSVCSNVGRRKRLDDIVCKVESV